MNQRNDLGPITREDADAWIGLCFFLFLVGAFGLFGPIWMVIFIGVPLMLIAGLGLLFGVIGVAAQGKRVKEAKAEKKREQYDREIILAAKWFRD